MKTVMSPYTPATLLMSLERVFSQVGTNLKLEILRSPRRGG